MKYGERLFHKYFGCVNTFCYRMDPVPRTGKPKWTFGKWYKRPQTTQERRAFYAYPEYVRGRRHACNLPETWNDAERADIRTRKSWKSKKIKYQWMKKRG